jgi:hypothetical protein
LDSLRRLVTGNEKQKRKEEKDTEEIQRADK